MKKQTKLIKKKQNYIKFPLKIKIKKYSFKIDFIIILKTYVYLNHYKIDKSMKFLKWAFLIYLKFYL